MAALTEQESRQAGSEGIEASALRAWREESRERGWARREESRARWQFVVASVAPRG